MANAYERDADAMRVLLTNPDGATNYVPQVQNGASRVVLYDGSGNPLLLNSLKDLKVQQQELVSVTNTAAAGAAVTLTIPAGAGGIFNYLQWLQIQCYATAARTGGATPTIVTMTGLPGLWTFNFPTAMAVGTMADAKVEGGVPVKGSAAATTITVVCPATTSVIWVVNAAYFQA